MGQTLKGNILEVGPGKTFANPLVASGVAMPGDTILIYPNTYTGGYFISNLNGTPSAPICFIGTDASSVIFQGNNQAFQFSEVSYLNIENITIRGQTANGINIDDGGSFESPSHHITVKNCRFLDMNASGNNDLLKLSGIDYFRIEACIFRNGSAGGSGIDMVGCHHGTIIGNNFENLGSNSIQAKGGSQYLEISQNKFKNGGQRTLNLGGSTGLAFFRPQNATFEAADINVFANVIIGSTAAIAFVGCVRVNVVNNTIINPSNWIIRILQETVDINRFLPCGNNVVKNNIIYFGTLSTHVNVGSNTAPTTFIFSNNLWYRNTNPGTSAPNLPVTEIDPINGQNPQFIDLQNDNFGLMTGSPAIDHGDTTSFHKDFTNLPRPLGLGFDIGAYEKLAPTILSIEGNREVCYQSGKQSYTIKSLFSDHFVVQVFGGTLQGWQSSDTVIYINWDTLSTEQSIQVTTYSSLNEPGNTLNLPVVLTSGDSISWVEGDGLWTDRNAWSKYTLPQVCHDVIIHVQNASITIPEGEIIKVNSLNCQFNNVINLLQNSRLEIINLD